MTISKTAKEIANEWEHGHERAQILELQILRHMEHHVAEAIKAAREACAKIAEREVWVRSGGVAARNVAKAIRLGKTDVSDDMMEGFTPEDPN